MALVNFNIPGQRIPAAAVGPAYQAGMTNINEFAPDQGMVNALLQRGSSTAPVQSVQEGLYRALTGVAGGYMKGRDKRNLQSQRDAYGEAVMGALAKGQGTPGTPEKFEVLSTPVDPRISSAELSLLETEGALPPSRPAALGSILDDPSVPDVAALGLRRVGDQVVEQEAAPAVDAVAEVKGTPGGLQPMLDALRGDGTRDPRLQSALNEYTALMQYGGLQDKAALEDKATARALTVSDQERVRSQEVEDRDLGYENALALKEAERGDGLYAGTSVQAQNLNMLLNPDSDTSSPAYRSAFIQESEPRITLDSRTGQMVTVTPDMSAYRPPAAPPAAPAPNGEEGPPAVVQRPPAGQTVNVTQIRAPVDPAMEAKKRVTWETIGNVEDAYGRYRKLILETGPTLIPGESKLVLSAGYADLMLQLKELAKLGVLAGPDMEIMAQIIKDPTKLGAQMYDRNSLLAQLDQVLGPKVQAARGRTVSLYGEALLKPFSYDGIPLITTQEEHDALEVGDQFREESGGPVLIRQLSDSEAGG